MSFGPASNHGKLQVGEACAPRKGTGTTCSSVNVEKQGSHFGWEGKMYRLFCQRGKKYYKKWSAG